MKEKLATRMRLLAETYPTKSAELIQKAEALEKASAVVMGPEKPTKDQIAHMVGCWARARRIYCVVTGESLV